jgi:ketosteroid isomerase-like protein
MSRIMKHTNVVLLEKAYSDFSKGNWDAFLGVLPDQMTFQVSGKSKIAGKFTKANFVAGYAGQLQELSGGTFQTEIHDVMATDLHATVLATNKVTRAGKTIELRTVHVWRFQEGKPVAWYEYPRDLYLYDSIWS